MRDLEDIKAADAVKPLRVTKLHNDPSPARFCNIMCSWKFLPQFISFLPTLGITKKTSNKPCDSDDGYNPYLKARGDYFNRRLLCLFRTNIPKNVEARCCHCHCCPRRQMQGGGGALAASLGIGELGKEGGPARRRWRRREEREEGRRDSAFALPSHRQSLIQF